MFKTQFLLLLFIVAAIGCNSTKDQSKLQNEMFAYKNKDAFNLDYMRDNTLQEITDKKLLKMLKELTGLEPYKNEKWGYSFYFYSKEDRLKNFEEFTVVFNQPEEYSLFYIIMDKNGKGTGYFPCAYSSGGGDYVEDATGKFTGTLEYTLHAIGDGDTEYDGYEAEESGQNEFRRVFEISKNGTVTEKKGEQSEEKKPTTNVEDEIKNIRKLYNKTVGSQKEGVLTKTVYSFMFDTYYFYTDKNKELVKVEKIVDADDGTSKTEFYTHKGNLYFVFETGYDSFLEESGKDGNTENRIYFKDEEIIRFLDKDKKEKTVNNSESLRYLEQLEEAIANINKAEPELNNQSNKALDYSGEYSYEKGEKKDDVSFYSFELKIIQSEDGKLSGGYAAWTNYGHKMDGLESFECKISGEIVDGVANLKYTSCRDDKTGTAKLSFNDGKWIWETTGSEIVGICPSEAILTKM